MSLQLNLGKMSSKLAAQLDGIPNLRRYSFFSFYIQDRRDGKIGFSSCNRQGKTKCCINLYIIRERTNQEVIIHRLLCCSPRVSNFYAQRNKGTAHLEKRAAEKTLSS